MRRLRNDIWTHFAPSKDSDHFKCLKCQEEVLCLRGSTTHLRSHIKDCHPNFTADVKTVGGKESLSSLSSPYVTFLHEDELLLKEISDVWETKAHSDLNIVCLGDGQVVKTHKLLIGGLSSYLRTLMLCASDSDETLTIVLPDVRASTLEEFLARVFLASDEDAIIDDSIKHLGFGIEGEDSHSEENVEEPNEENKCQLVSESIGIIELDLCKAEPSIEPESCSILKRKRKVLDPRKNRSPTWDFFLKVDSSTALCKTCKVEIKTETGNTSGMAAHLRVLHPALFEAMKRIGVRKDSDETSEEEYDEESETNASNDQIGEPSKSKRRKRSLIWKYFDQIGSALALCKNCKVTIKTETGNTTGMINHIKASHKDLFLEFLDSRGDLESTTIPTKDSNANPESEGNRDAEVNLDSEDDHPDIVDNSLSEEAWKSSPVWQFFDNCQNGQVQCVDCNKALKIVPYSTAKMIFHLKNYHSDLYENSIRDKLQNPILPDTGDTSHPIWTYFEIFNVDDQEGESLARCLACRVVLPFPDSVSKLEAHIEQNHETIRIEYERLCGVWKLQRLEEADVAFKVEKKKQNTRSAVWNYFDKTEEKTKNICKTCDKVIVCNQQNTTNMIRHLECNHQILYNEFLKDSVLPGEEVVEVTKNIVRRRRGPKPMMKNDPTNRTCPECQKVFSCRPAMLYHRKTVHSGVRPYKCNDCGMTFSRPDSFRGHTHNKVRSYLCSLCGKTFARKNIRDQHERAHRGDKRYSCSFCEKLFMTNQQKANHERTHTGEKPFQCNECGRQFAQQHQLTTHMRIHTGEKPYSCPRCDQKFRHLSSRNNHKCDTKVTTEATWNDDETELIEEEHDLLDS